MSVTNEAPINRWTWRSPLGSVYGSAPVRISKPRDRKDYKLEFAKPDIYMETTEIQDFIDSLQEIIGPRADKHVAFPEVTEIGVGKNGLDSTGPVL